MQVEGWRYYNHAAIPTTAPDEKPSLLPLQNGSLWKTEEPLLLARWTTEFDCGVETNWWYIIKDTPFDVSSLNAKRRYVVNKGVKNFITREIDPADYAEELCDVQLAAFSAYPPKYRPTVDRQSFVRSTVKWRGNIVVGAFDRETKELCGYALLRRISDKCVDFNVLKADPKREKNGVNAALVEGVLRCLDSFLKSGGYICDGARSINHESSFQEYLEKYFGFRKAYCRLHIEYAPKIKWLIKLIYPVRKLLLCFDGIGFAHSINSVLKMEEICRSEKS